MYGTYFPSPALAIANYASIVVATAVYAIVLGKFYRASRIPA